MRPGAHLHFVGIGGAGMSALAQVMLGRGYRVSGCDLRESDATDRLRGHGGTVQLGHSTAHLAGVDLVVYSRAIAGENDELHAARRAGLPILHRAALLGHVMAEGHGVAVVGTHGKTTTTAMVARVLTHAALDPTALIGADVPEYAGNVRSGRGPWVVAEVDESDGSLLQVRPYAAVLTSLDATDHRDFYTSAAHLRETFVQFLRGVDPAGFVALCVDHPEVRALRGSLSRPVITYGCDPAATVHGVTTRVAGESTHTAVWVDGQPAGELVLHVPGRHNVANALGAIAAALQVGVPFTAASEALASYRGAARRFAVRGEAAGVLVVDDYAHNPVKVAAVLRAAREGWPERRVIALFQPHRFSRTRTTHAEFGGAFEAADEVIVTEIYAADEAPQAGVSARLIVDAIARQRPVHFRPTAQEALDLLVTMVAPGDIVLTLGAGNIGDAADELVTRLAAHAPAAPGARALGDRP
jgi:UDP-N-acetylmuramate--alanine ligase